MGKIITKKDIGNETYKIIYADPPWYYKGNVNAGRVLDKRSDISASLIYPTMKPAEMEAEFGPMINQLADPLGALMFMWVTNSHWPQAINLAKSAGFEFVNVAFVWNKLKTNLGAYTNPQCEYVALFKKGMPVKSLGKCDDCKVRQLVEVKAERKHSRKPDIVRQKIIDLWPEAKRIELFARDLPEGFDVFGNEVGKYEINK